MKLLPATLAFMATLWPVLLGAALFDRVGGTPGWLSAVTYLGASHVCHQRSDRSFVTGGHTWPVCGRCAGLYLAAPAGAWLAFSRRRRAPLHAVPFLLAAAMPSILTVIAELARPDAVTSMSRALAAVPLGAAVAYVVVAAAGRPAESIG